MFRRIPTIGYITKFFASENSEEKTVSSPLENLTPKDIDLIAALKEKSSILKSKNEVLLDAYNAVKPLYSSEKLLSLACQQAIKLKFIDKSVIWEPTFPFGFLKILTETHKLLEDDANTIRRYAKTLGADPYKKIYLARNEFKEAFLSAAKKYLDHSNSVYQKAAHKELAVRALDFGAKIFGKYANIKLVESRYSIQWIIVDKPATFLSLAEELNQLFSMDTQDKRAKDAFSSAQVAIAQGFLQEEWRKLLNLNTVLFFNLRTKIPFSISEKDAELDREIVEILQRWDLIREDYETFKNIDKLIGETEQLTDIFKELKTYYDRKHKEIVGEFAVEFEGLSVQVNSIGASLLESSNRLDTQLNSDDLPNCYLLYKTFRETEQKTFSLIQKINQTKLKVHNQYENLKIAMGGIAIEEERKITELSVDGLQMQLGMPLRKVAELRGKIDFKAGLIVLEKEYVLKNVIKTLKNDTLNQERIKTHWSKQTYTWRGLGGASITVKEEKTATDLNLKVPHGIAFMTTRLNSLTNEEIDRMSIEEVVALLKSFKTKIAERESKRASIFSLFSCVNLEVKVRQDTVVELYQGLKGLNLEHPEPCADQKFLFTEIFKATLPHIPFSVPAHRRVSI